MHGFGALVVPVRTTANRPAVLKVSFPDDESEHEHLALQHWHGNGAVQLLRADPHRSAMLLERLHPERLTELWDLEACEIVAGLYAQLHVPAIPQLRPLTAYVDRWADDLAELPAQRTAPASDGRAGGLAVARLRRRPGEHRHADPRRPALRERDGRRPRALAGDRPEADVRRPALRARADAVEPVRGARAATCGTAVRPRSTRSSTTPGSTRTGPATGSSYGCCTTRCWRLQDEPDAERITPDEEYLTMCIAIAKAVQD